jgi:hypothetical protein
MMGFAKSDPRAKRMMLCFTKMVVRTNTAVVTRLNPATGSPIRVLGCDGAPAQTGDLQLALDLSLNITEDQAGFEVLKDIEGITFKRGPVVEGLIAGSNVTIVPVTGMGEVAGDVVHGRATLNVVVPGSDQSEGMIALVALDKVLEDKLYDTFFLSFPQGVASSLRGRIEVPRSGVIANPKMELWFWFLSRLSGVLPDIAASYRRLARPSGYGTVDLPTSDTALANLTFSAYSSVGANKYIEAVSASFPIAQGDEVFFTLSRGAADSYAANLGLVRMGFRIFPGT